MLSPLCRTTAKQVAKTLSSPPLFDKNLKIWRKSRFLEEEVEEAWIRSVSNVTLLLYLYEGLNFGSELFAKCVELFGLLCACTTLHSPTSALVIYAHAYVTFFVPYWRKILQRMAWQPSRVVPGLSQYLASKGLAFAPTQTTCCVPNSMQLDAAHPEDAERVIPSTIPPAKRLKVDTPSLSIPPKSLPISSAHCDVPVPASIDDLPPLLRESLLPFQKEGITFAINRGGRVLIGDDMGLGSKSPLTLPHPLSLTFFFCLV